jgi:hypothetical protein
VILANNLTETRQIITKFLSWNFLYPGRISNTSIAAMLAGTAPERMSL